MRGRPKRFFAYLRWILKKRSLSFILYGVVGIFILFLLKLISFFLFENLAMIFFIVVLMFLGVITDSINRFMPFSIGFELIMMATVLTARVYSPITGLMVGIISLTISELFIMKFKIGLLVSFFGLAVVAFLSSIFSGVDITGIGIVLTLVYNAIIIPGYYFTGSNPLKLFIFSSTHIAWNIYVFMKIAPWFLGLMA